VTYVTVVNWGIVEGQNASAVVKPQTGKLTWRTDRPIYDLRLGRRVTPAEAATVDLTQDGFRVYALPPREVGTPRVTFHSWSEIGPYLSAEVGAGLAGVPLTFTVRGGQTATTFHTMSKLIVPMSRVAPGTQLAVTELLSGRSTTVPVPAGEPPSRHDADRLRRARTAFAIRKDVPLTVALTPAQAADPGYQGLAQRMIELLRKAGRNASLGRVEPGGVVVGLQTVKAVQRYPQWQTIASDLVLMGTPQDNPLIYDQSRGGLLDAELERLRTSGAVSAVTYSPFVGGFQALNLLGSDAQAIERAMDGLDPF
jgi:hypothetical protein